jgi:hypothetical protein
MSAREIDRGLWEPRDHDATVTATTNDATAAGDR